MTAYHSPAERSEVYRRGLRAAWRARQRTLRETAAVAVLCGAILTYFLLRSLP